MKMKTSMKKNYESPKKQIKNLEELRLAKKRIKSDLVKFENEYDQSLPGKAINLLTTFRYDNNFASSKIEESLYWLGNKASKKFPMNGVTKIVISGLIMVAVPMITSKIQEFIEKKLK